MSERLLMDEPEEGVRRVTLNRPAALNAFDFPMYEELTALLQALRDDQSVRVVIVTGAGRAFCAGHDIRAPGEPGGVAQGLGRMQRGKLIYAKLTAIPQLIRALPQPVIAAVNGAAAGIGFALAIAADMVLIGESGKFVNAVHNAGTGAELGMSWLLPRIVGLQKAAEILFTARPIDAGEAARIGLALRSVPDADLAGQALALAREIAVNAPIGIWLTKQTMWLGQQMNFEAALEMEGRGTQISQATADAAEKRKAFLEKRPPRFENL